MGAFPPLVGEGVNRMLVPAQTGPEGLDEMLTAGTSVELTVMVIALEVAVSGEAQTAFEVMTTVTTSLLFKVVEVKVAPVPALLPFTCHW